MSGFRTFLQAPGARTFGAVWIGQFVSLLGSSMTRFGLAIWVFTETGSATQLALIVVASQVPALLVSPFVGALVDRWDRRVAMIVSDTGAAVATVATLALIATGSLEIWHLYVTLSFGGLFGAFQFPAYSAALTVLIPKEHYARASGLVQLAGSLGSVLAPAIAGTLVVTVGLGPLFAIDVVSYLVAVGILAYQRFPAVPPSDRLGRGVRGLLLEAREGLAFVLERRGLMILLLSFLMVNFALAFQGVLLIPLLLSLTTEQVAGVVASVGAVGVTVGTLALTVWGGPRNKALGVYGSIAVVGAGLMLIGLQPTLWLVIVGLFSMMLAVPVASGTSQALWQAKVPPRLQGRVFAIRQVSAIGAMPVAFLAAGLLADRVFEPLFTEGGFALATLFGTGPGRGTGFLFSCTGVIALLVAAWAVRHPRIRGLETEVPDADAAPAMA